MLNDLITLKQLTQSFTPWLSSNSLCHLSDYVDPKTLPISSPPSTLKLSRSLTLLVPFPRHLPPPLAATDNPASPKRKPHLSPPPRRYRTLLFLSPKSPVIGEVSTRRRTTWSALQMKVVGSVTATEKPIA